MPLENIIQDEQIVIQRQEIDDLIGNAPRWILRSGITVVFIVTIIVLIMAWLIKYPDKIEAHVMVVGENPPIEVVAETPGKIYELFVHNGDTVYEKSNLWYIENIAERNDIEKVSVFLDEVKSIEKVSDYLKIITPENLQLGELNNSFVQFAEKYKSFQQTLEQTAVFKKIASIEREIKQTRRLNASLKRQSTIFGNELKLSEKDYKRNLQLNKDKTVSDLALEKTEERYLQQKRQFENMQTGIIQNGIRVEQLRSQKIELKEKRKKLVNDNILQINEMIRKLKSEMKEWENRYFAKAPIEGIITFKSEVSKKQFVKTGEPIMTIVPFEKKNAIKALCKLTPEGYGKIESGNKVQIRLDAFPYKEFGSIETQIQQSAILPMRNAEGKLEYELEISLPDSLTTDYHKLIPFKQRMTGRAMIITEEKRILDRVFDKVTNILRN